MAIKLTAIFFLLSISLANAQFYSLQFDENRALSITVKTRSEFSVKRKGSDKAIMGKYHQKGDFTQFIPYIPFGLGQEYVVWIKERKEFTFIPQANLAGPKIDKIFPEQPLVPANFLKFYLLFDQPMANITPYKNISIWKNEQKLNDAILNLDPALWDETGKILTVWLEPGLVKSDLGPNRRLGRILEKGDTILIKVDSLRSEKGIFMTADFTKSYVVTAEDGIQPSLKDWTVSSPTINTREPLFISFMEPMDYMSSTTAIEILKDDKVFEGSFFMVSDSVLRFLPKARWESGDYLIEVNGSLEDLAANNLNRLFEEDLKRRTKSSEKSVFHMNFQLQ